ncbi:unnamed protein product [Ostreobium quekettii]|uniref:Histone-lysine N-methyltransferase ASHH2 n=1 Tax=Ostreobium quekettii TaxID=121088 RepID=A0A8S1IKK4_9CHLO|nr:unnamed protein product [Ostreobium quekettii]
MPRPLYGPAPCAQTTPILPSLSQTPGGWPGARGAMQPPAGPSPSPQADRIPGDAPASPASAKDAEDAKDAPRRKMLGPQGRRPGTRRKQRRKGASGIGSGHGEGGDLVLKPPRYRHTPKNTYVNRSPAPFKRSDAYVCDCRSRELGGLDCGEGCLNRCVNVECTPGCCPCGERCQNQRLQRKEYAETRLVMTGPKGWGVVADEDIKAGALITEYVGEVVKLEEADRRSRKYEARGDRHTYIMNLSQYEVIDATEVGNFSRFINHSCEPNCETQKWTVRGEMRIAIFAIKDVPKGKEMTYHYNLDWNGGERVRCCCGSAKCLGYLGAQSAMFKRMMKQEQLLEQHEGNVEIMQDSDGETYLVDKLDTFDSDSDVLEAEGQDQHCMDGTQTVNGWQNVGPDSQSKDNMEKCRGQVANGWGSGSGTSDQTQVEGAKGSQRQEEANGLENGPAKKSPGAAGKRAVNGSKRDVHPEGLAQAPNRLRDRWGLEQEVMVKRRRRTPATFVELADEKHDGQEGQWMKRRRILQGGASPGGAEHKESSNMAMRSPPVPSEGPKPWACTVAVPTAVAKASSGVPACQKESLDHKRSGRHSGWWSAHQLRGVDGTPRLQLVGQTQGQQLIPNLRSLYDDRAQKGARQGSHRCRSPKASDRRWLVKDKRSKRTAKQARQVGRSDPSGPKPAGGARQGITPALANGLWGKPARTSHDERCSTVFNATALSCGAGLPVASAPPSQQLPCTAPPDHRLAVATSQNIMSSPIDYCSLSLGGHPQTRPGGLACPSALTSAHGLWAGGPTCGPSTVQDQSLFGMQGAGALGPMMTGGWQGHPQDGTRSQSIAADTLGAASQAASQSIIPLGREGTTGEDNGPPNGLGIRCDQPLERSNPVLRLRSAQVQPTDPVPSPKRLDGRCKEFVLQRTPPATVDRWTSAGAPEFQGTDKLMGSDGEHRHDACRTEVVMPEVMLEQISTIGPSQDANALASDNVFPLPLPKGETSHGRAAGNSSCQLSMPLSPAKAPEQMSPQTQQQLASGACSLSCSQSLPSGAPSQRPQQHITGVAGAFSCAQYSTAGTLLGETQQQPTDMTGSPSRAQYGPHGAHSQSPQQPTKGIVGSSSSSLYSNGGTQLQDTGHQLTGTVGALSCAQTDGTKLPLCEGEHGCRTSFPPSGLGPDAGIGAVGTAELPSSPRLTVALSTPTVVPTCMERSAAMELEPVSQGQHCGHLKARSGIGMRTFVEGDCGACPPVRDQGLLGSIDGGLGAADGPVLKPKALVDTAATKSGLADPGRGSTCGPAPKVDPERRQMAQHVLHVLDVMAGLEP